MGNLSLIFIPDRIWKSPYRDAWKMAALPWDVDCGARSRQWEGPARAANTKRERVPSRHPAVAVPQRKAAPLGHWAARNAPRARQDIAAAPLAPSAALPTCGGSMSNNDRSVGLQFPARGHRLPKKSEMASTKELGQTSLKCGLGAGYDLVRYMPEDLRVGR